MHEYWYFLIPGIIVALFSDKIDKAANANKKLKKWLIGLSAVLLVVIVLLIIKSIKVIV